MLSGYLGNSRAPYTPYFNTNGVRLRADGKFHPPLFKLEIGAYLTLLTGGPRERVRWVTLAAMLPIKRGVERS